MPRGGCKPNNPCGMQYGLLNPFFQNGALLGSGGSLSAGPDQNINSGSTVQLAGSGSGTWTSSGTGTFDDDGIPNAVYTPSMVDVINGSVVLTYSNGVQSDDMTTTITLIEQYIKDNISISFWAIGDEATASGGNVTGWNEKISGNAITLEGTLTKVDAAIDGKGIVRTNGTNNGFRFARKTYKWRGVVLKRYAGIRAMMTPASDASTNAHAGFSFIDGSPGRKFDVLPTENTSYQYNYNADENAAGDANKKFFWYFTRHNNDYNENASRKFRDNTGAVADVSSTATNMLFAYQAEGDNGGTKSNWLRGDYAEIIMGDGELTGLQMYLLEKWIKNRYGSTLSISRTAYEPIAAATPIAGNPLVTGHSQGLAGQFYPPMGVKISGITYLLCKSDSEGYMAKSGVDNDTYSEISGIKIGPGGAGTWDEQGFRGGSYYSDGTTIYEIYLGRNGSGVEQIGIATTLASTPEGTYTKDAGNPHITVAAVNTALGSSYTSLGVATVCKEGSTYYWFFNAFTASVCDWIVATSSSITGAKTIVRRLLRLPQDGPPRKASDALVQYGGVIKKNNRFFALLTCGHFDSDIENERQIYLASSATIDNNWSVYRDPLITINTTNGSWNERRVYACNALYENDGNWLTPTEANDLITLFAAGHGTGVVNAGLPGIWRVNKNLYATISY